MVCGVQMRQGFGWCWAMFVVLGEVNVVVEATLGKHTCPITIHFWATSFTT